MAGPDTTLAQGLDVQALLCDDRRVRPAEVHPNPFDSSYHGDAYMSRIVRP